VDLNTGTTGQAGFAWARGCNWIRDHGRGDVRTV